MYTELPAVSQTLYAELLEQLLTASYSQNGISPLKIKVKDSDYWYLEFTIGKSRRRQYIGPDNKQNRLWVERFKQTKIQNKDLAQERRRLVSMLASAGFQAITGREYRVFEALEQTGMFLAGGVVVGSHAFNMIGNSLGVQWETQLTRTQDIDIADDFRIHVGLPKHDTDIEKALKSADENFMPIPALNRKSPSTSFSIRGAQLRVDILTPMIGKTSSKPIALKSIKAMAEPVRFLDFLLEDTQPAAVIAGAGILANIPNPARYALHKLVVSQRRQPAFQAKAKKDLQQAEAVLHLLKIIRPGDIDIVMQAARKMPDRFMEQLQAGLKMIDIAL